MRVALIIGVSTYASAGNLPGCAADVAVIAALIKGSNRFDRILELSDGAPSSNIKARLVSFFSDLEGQEVAEFFFYFTGHGEFFNDELYYLLGDYIPSKRNQTSLQNAELDNLIRNLRPDLTVKVVDACQSGVQYIKEPGSLQKYLESKREGFSSCYFMFSSHTNEYSYQDPNGLSHFTLSYLESVMYHSGTSIRYKDIIDYISDAFASDANQTPFFVIQGKNTEIFSDLTEEFKTSLISHMSTRGQKSGDKSDSPASTTSKLVEIIKAEASHYCTKERLFEALNLIRDELPSYQYLSDLGQLYDVKVQFLESRPLDLPDVSSIGRWIDEFGADYFAVAEALTRRVEEEIVDTTATNYQMLRIQGKDLPKKKVIRDKRTVSGYLLTQDINYQIIEIYFESKFENLASCVAFIAPIFSKRHLRFFLNLCPLKESNWDTRSVLSLNKWSTDLTEYHSDEEVRRWLSNFISRIEAQIMEPLRARFVGAEENESAILLADSPPASPTV